MTYYDELYHHGILGQKWGVRRYQNPDGSLTAEGRKRYLNDDGSFNKKGARKFKYYQQNGEDPLNAKDRLIDTEKKALISGAVTLGASVVGPLLLTAGATRAMMNGNVGLGAGLSATGIALNRIGTVALSAIGTYGAWNAAKYFAQNGKTINT